MGDVFSQIMVSWLILFAIRVFVFTFFKHMVYSFKQMVGRL